MPAGASVRDGGGCAPRSILHGSGRCPEEHRGGDVSPTGDAPQRCSRQQPTSPVESTEPRGGELPAAVVESAASSLLPRTAHVSADSERASPSGASHLVAQIDHARAEGPRLEKV